MYIIAIIGDIGSLIPFLNIVTDFLTAFLLALVAGPGESIYSNDIGLTLGTIVLESVPGLSMLPTWTLRVWWAKRQAKKRGGA